MTKAMSLVLAFLNIFFMKQEKIDGHQMYISNQLLHDLD
jgi:hypothetical protein